MSVFKRQNLSVQRGAAGPAGKKMSGLRFPELRNTPLPELRADGQTLTTSCVCLSSASVHLAHKYVNVSFFNEMNELYILDVLQFLFVFSQQDKEEIKSRKTTESHP